MNHRLQIYTANALENARRHPLTTAASVGLFFFVCLILSNDAHTMTRLAFRGQLDKSVFHEVCWDSGAGFNTYECHSSVRQRDGFVSFPLPQVALESVRLLIEPSQQTQLEQPQLWVGSGGERRSFGLVNASHSSNEFAFEVQDIDNSHRSATLTVTQFSAALLFTWLVYYLLTRWEHLRRLFDASDSFRTDFRRFGAFFASALLGFLPWLLGSWPGAMTVDSMRSWAQTRTLAFTDYHPYFYKFYLLALQQLTDSPGWICLFQISWAAALGAWVATRCLRKGAPKTLVWVTHLLFVCLPPIASSVSWVVKDVPYTLAMLTLSVIFFELRSRRYETRAAACWHVIGLVCVLMLLAAEVRHNGVLLYAMVPVATLWLVPRRQAIVVGCVSISCFLLFSLAVPRMLDVQGTLRALERFSYTDELIDMVSSPDFVTPPGTDVKRELENLTTRSWQELVAMKGEGRSIHKMLSPASRSRARQVLLEAIPYNLPTYAGLFIGDKVEQALKAYGFSSKSIRFYNHVPNAEWTPRYEEIFPEYKMRFAPVAPSIGDWTQQVLEESMGFDGVVSPGVLLWNELVPLLLFVAAIFIAGPTSPLAFYSYLPVLNSLALIAAGAGRMWRYNMHLYLGCVFLVALFAVTKKGGQARTARFP